jgi:hypothetical protein
MAARSRIPLCDFGGSMKNFFCADRESFDFPSDFSEIGVRRIKKPFD